MHFASVCLRLLVSDSLCYRNSGYREALMETKSAKIMSALKDDTGLTTTEYAVGTVAVAGLSGLLLKLLTSDSLRDLIWSVISNAFSRFFG